MIVKLMILTMVMFSIVQVFCSPSPSSLILSPHPPAPLLLLHPRQPHFLDRKIYSTFSPRWCYLLWKDTKTDDMILQPKKITSSCLKTNKYHQHHDHNLDHHPDHHHEQHHCPICPIVTSPKESGQRLRKSRNLQHHHHHHHH